MGSFVNLISHYLGSSLYRYQAPTVISLSSPLWHDSLQEQDNKHLRLPGAGDSFQHTTEWHTSCYQDIRKPFLIVWGCHVQGYGVPSDMESKAVPGSICNLILTLFWPFYSGPIIVIFFRKSYRTEEYLLYPSLSHLSLIIGCYMITRLSAMSSSQNKYLTTST